MGNLFGWIAIITTCILLAIYIPWWIVLIIAVIIALLYALLPKYREFIFNALGATIVMVGVIALFYLAWHLFNEILPT
jgi:hypothetical protein